MPAQNVEELAAHAAGGDHIFAAPDLPDFCADDFGNARPAGDADDDGECPYIGIPQNGLQKQHQQQTGHAEEDLRKTHHQRIQPYGCNAADRAIDHSDESGDRCCHEADGDGDPAAVPDAGENITA